jgi:hypothetical protein
MKDLVVGEAGTGVEDLEFYTFGAEPFTAAELAGVARYSRTVYASALYDCFDAFDIEHIRWHERAFGPAETREMLAAHGMLLSRRAEAVDSLLADLATCTAERTCYGTAARRCLEAKADEYHRTRQAFERAVTVWALGLADGGLDGYPPITRGVDFAMQALSADPSW